MTDKTQYPFSSNIRLTLSEDSLIRLPYDVFKGIAIVHFYSELTNTTNNHNATPSNRKTRLCGLTEWISVGLTPVLSIGWKWKLSTINNSSDYQIDSPPFSNIMFVNKNNEDIGKHPTEHLLIQYINNLNWSAKVKEYLNEKYAWQPI